MAGMGPAPKPASQRRRQNKTNAVMRLPKTGRTGPVPPWPLSKRMTKPESALWTELWGTPQAVAWETFGWSRVVARYVAVTLLAETTFSAPLLSEARQLEDRLGLSPMAMLRLRWEIIEGGDETADGGESSVTALADYRAMLEDDDDGE